MKVGEKYCYQHCVLSNICIYISLTGENDTSECFEFFNLVFNLLCINIFRPDPMGLLGSERHPPNPTQTQELSLRTSLQPSPLLGSQVPAPQASPLGKAGGESRILFPSPSVWPWGGQSSPLGPPVNRGYWHTRFLRLFAKREEACITLILCKRTTLVLFPRAGMGW